MFVLLDRKHVERACAAWANEAFERTQGETVAIDGKRLRRARGAGHSMMTVMAAWATGQPTWR